MIREADDLALVVATALPDAVAVDPTAGLGADLLDPTGSPDSEAAIAALGGWSALLLPALVELAGDDPELLALIEAMGPADALEADLLADIAAEVERATGADAPQEAASGGNKPRDHEHDTEGAAAFGLLAATRGPAVRSPAARAADGSGATDGQSGGLSGQKAANLATAFGFIKDAEGGEIVKALPAFSVSQAKDGLTVSQTIDFGGADRDTIVAIEVEKDGRKAGGSLRFRVTGSSCPDADGTVKMEFKVQLDATAGSASTSDGFEGTATGHVDDSATLTGFEYEGRATTRKAAPGRSTWVESMTTASYGTALEQDGSMRSTLKEGSGIRPSRWSSQADREDAGRAVANAQQLFAFVQGLFANWQGLWRSGFCVKIKADIPATVKPSEQRTSDVHVAHKDGSELDAPVDATLSGPQSLDPLRIDHAPGQLTYTAGDHVGDTATVDLVSTSRRGIGKLSQTIRIGVDSYQISGTIPGEPNGTQLSGQACSLDEPFEVKTKGDFIGTVSFQPSSDAGGTWSYKGKVFNAPFKTVGSGTYRAGLTGDRSSGAIDMDGKWTIKIPGVGDQSRSPSVRLTLTQAPPCAR